MCAEVVGQCAMAIKGYRSMAGERMKQLNPLMISMNKWAE